MPSWTVSTDRRKGDRPHLLRELQELAGTIDGLHLEILPAEDYHQSPDGGGFRDFAPLAIISHPSLQALEIVAEELLAEFGWLVDFSK